MKSRLNEDYARLVSDLYRDADFFEVLIDLESVGVQASA